MSQWYYSHGGQQKGPVPLSELQRLAANGEFDPQVDLVWKEGMDDWKPGSTIPELGPAPAPTPAGPPGSPPAGIPAEAPAPVAQPDQPAPSSYVAPAPQSQPAAPAAAPVTPQAAPKTGLAMTSMICGIVGLVACICIYLSIPASLVAVVLGHIAASKIKADPVGNGGAGMARAGMITGYLGLILAVVMIGLAVWVRTLSPEDIEGWDWMPPEQREEILRSLEEQRRLQGGD